MCYNTGEVCNIYLHEKPGLNVNPNPNGPRSWTCGSWMHRPARPQPELSGVFRGAAQDGVLPSGETETRPGQRNQDSVPPMKSGSSSPPTEMLPPHTAPLRSLTNKRQGAVWQPPRVVEQTPALTGLTANISPTCVRLQHGDAGGGGASFHRRASR